MGHEDTLTAGWYGKIPSLGDFTSRHLPSHFIDIWDHWLQHAIAASRAQLGARWLDLYLTGPIWRFIVMPGICSDDMWTGILMPSVDKVGRYFPLTIAMQIRPEPGMLLTAFSAQTWYEDLEQLALASLDTNMLPDDLDRGLIKHPFPPFSSIDKTIPTQEFVTWWQLESQPEQTAHKSFSLPTADALIRLFNATTENMLINTGTGKSIWWKVSPPTKVQSTQLHCFTGLPSDNDFSTLLKGVEVK